MTLAATCTMTPYDRWNFIRMETIKGQARPTKISITLHYKKMQTTFLLITVILAFATATVTATATIPLFPQHEISTVQQRSHDEGENNHDCQFWGPKTYDIGDAWLSFCSLYDLSDRYLQDLGVKDYAIRVKEGTSATFQVGLFDSWTAAYNYGNYGNSTEDCLNTNCDQVFDETTPNLSVNGLTWGPDCNGFFGFVVKCLSGTGDQCKFDYNVGLTQTIECSSFSGTNCPTSCCNLCGDRCVARTFNETEEDYTENCDGTTIFISGAPSNSCSIVPECDPNADGSDGGSTDGGSTDGGSTDGGSDEPVDGECLDSYPDDDPVDGFEAVCNCHCCIGEACTPVCLGHFFMHPDDCESDCSVGCALDYDECAQTNSTIAEECFVASEDPTASPGNRHGNWIQTFM